MNASISPRFHASCCIISTALTSDCGDCAESDADPRVPVTRHETTKQITRINIYGVGIAVGEGVGVINGIAVGVGVGVATKSEGVGVAVGVGRSVDPSFDGNTSNIISDPDDALVPEEVAVVVVADVEVVTVGVGVGVG